MSTSEACKCGNVMKQEVEGDKRSPWSTTGRTKIDNSAERYAVSNGSSST